MLDFHSYPLAGEDFIQPGNLISESEPESSRDWRRGTSLTIGPHLDLAPQVNSLNHVGVSRFQATPQTGLSREEGQRPYNDDLRWDNSADFRFRQREAESIDNFSIRELDRQRTDDIELRSSATEIRRSDSRLLLNQAETIVDRQNSVNFDSNYGLSAGFNVGSNLGADGGRRNSVAEWSRARCRMPVICEDVEMPGAFTYPYRNLPIARSNTVCSSPWICQPQQMSYTSLTTGPPLSLLMPPSSAALIYETRPRMSVSYPSQPYPPWHNLEPVYSMPAVSRMPSTIGVSVTTQTDLTIASAMTLEVGTASRPSPPSLSLSSSLLTTSSSSSSSSSSLLLQSSAHESSSSAMPLSSSLGPSTSNPQSSTLPLSSSSEPPPPPPPPSTPPSSSTAQPTSSSAQAPSSSTQKLKGRLRLPNYDGTTSLLDFVKKFHMCSEANGWLKDEQYFNLAFSLTGIAAQLLWSEEPGEEKSVDVLLKKLHENFGSEHQLATYRVQLSLKKQGLNESLEQVSRDVQRLLFLSFPGQSSVHSRAIGVQSFLSSLANRKLALRVMETEPKTLQEAAQTAMKFDSFAVAELERAGELNRHRPKVAIVREVKSDDSLTNIEKRLAELERRERNGKPTCRGVKKSSSSSPGRSNQQSFSSFYSPPQEVVGSSPSCGAFPYRQPPQSSFFSPPQEGTFPSFQSSSREGAYQVPHPPPSVGCQPLQTVNGVYVPHPPLKVAKVTQNATYATASVQSPVLGPRFNRKPERRHQKRKPGWSNRQRFEYTEAECDAGLNKDMHSAEQVNLVRETAMEVIDRGNSSNSEQIAEPTVPAPEDVEKVCLTVAVNNEEVTAFLDTGSPISIAEAGLISKRLIRSTDRKLCAINNTPIDVIGKTRLQFRIGEYGCEVDCYVSPSAKGLLLGASWLRERKAFWDFDSQRVRLDGYWFNLENQSLAQQRCARVVVMETDSASPQKADEIRVSAACLAPVTNLSAVLESQSEDDSVTQLRPSLTHVGLVGKRVNAFSSCQAIVGEGCTAVNKTKNIRIPLLNWIPFLLVLVFAGKNRCKMSDRSDIDEEELRAIFDAGTPLLDEHPEGDDRETIAYSPISDEETIMYVDRASLPGETRSLFAPAASADADDVTSPPLPVVAVKVVVSQDSKTALDVVMPPSSAMVTANMVASPDPADVVDVDMVLPPLVVADNAVASTNPYPLESWKFAFASVLYLTFQHLLQKKGADVISRDVELLETVVPIEIKDFRPVRVILTLLQTLVSVPGFLQNLKEWSRRAQRVPTADHRCFQPTVKCFPLDEDSEWDPNLFGLSALVVGRFVELPIPGTGLEFLENVQDLMDLAGPSSRLVEMLVEALFFVKAPNWTWKLFPSH